MNNKYVKYDHDMESLMAYDKYGAGLAPGDTVLYRIYKDIFGMFSALTEYKCYVQKVLSENEIMIAGSKVKDGTIVNSREVVYAGHKSSTVKTRPYVPKSEIPPISDSINSTEIKQALVSRDSYTIDEGTMGFHDYTTHKEDMKSFIDSVSSVANDLEHKCDCEIINISYINEDLASIIYRKKVNHDKE